MVFLKLRLKENFEYKMSWLLSIIDMTIKGEFGNG